MESLDSTLYLKILSLRKELDNIILREIKESSIFVYSLPSSDKAEYFSRNVWYFYDKLRFFTLYINGFLLNNSHNNLDYSSKFISFFSSIWLLLEEVKKDDFDFFMKNDILFFDSFIESEIEKIIPLSSSKEHKNIIPKEFEISYFMEKLREIREI